MRRNIALSVHAASAKRRSPSGASSVEYPVAMRTDSPSSFAYWPATIRGFVARCPTSVVAAARTSLRRTPTSGFVASVCCVACSASTGGARRMRLELRVRFAVDRIRQRDKNASFAAIFDILQNRAIAQPRDDPARNTEPAPDEVAHRLHRVARQRHYAIASRPA